MGAKIYLLLAACIFTSGCEVGRRLAPPGFFKYEDLAQGKPVDPVIKEQADERREAGKVKFPLISSGPSALPQTTPASEREQSRDELLSARQKLDEAKAGDVERWAAEQAAEKAALERAAAALSAEVDALQAQADREKAERP